MPIAVVALFPAAPAAAATKSFSVGSGTDPGIYVDEAGTAHIVYSTDNQNGPDQIHYCRLKRAATTCDQVQTPVLTPVNPDHPQSDAINENGTGPKIYGVGDNLVILDKRTSDFWPTPTGSTLGPVLAYVSTDGGNSFSGPAVVGDRTGGIDGPAVVYGPDDDPRIATIGTETTGGTFFQAIGPGTFTENEANLGDDPSLSRAWYDGNVALDENGVPAASFSDDNGNHLRRWSNQGDPNDLATWGPPTGLPGTSGGRLAGGPKGLLFFEPEDVTTGDPEYFVHKLSGSTPAKGIQVTHSGDGGSGYGRFLRTPDGRSIAVWQHGGGIRETTSSDGTTWPKTDTVLITSPGRNMSSADAGVASDGGGFAVAHADAPDTSLTDAPILVAPFGNQDKTGKPGIGGVAGGGLDPGDDDQGTATCRDIHYEAVDIKPHAEGGCFFAGKGSTAGKEISDGPIDINGINLVPDAHVQTQISEKKHTIHTTGDVTLTLQKDGAPPITLWHGPLDSNLHGKGNAGAKAVLFDLNMSKFQAKVEGFPVAGHLPIVLAAGNSVTLPLQLKLPHAFGSQTANTTLGGKQDAGLDLTTLTIGPFDADIDGVGLTNVGLKFTNGTTWTGMATLNFPGPYPFKMTAQVTFVDGGYKDGHIDVSSYPGVPVFEGVYLTQLGFGLGLDPTTISGDATFGAVPLGVDEAFAISVRGDFHIKFGNPFVITIEGAGSVVSTEVADATLKYDSSIGFSAKAHAEIGGSTAGIIADASLGVGKVAGHLRWGGSASLQLEVFGFTKHIADIAVNDHGVGLCFPTPIPVGLDSDLDPIFTATVVHDWDDDPFLDVSAGCNVAAYGNPLDPAGRVRAAQAGPQQFTVPAGAAAEDLRVRGMGGAPAITVTDPTGKVVPGKPFADDGTQAAYFRMVKPAPGTYTVTAGVGPPIASVSTAQGYGTPVATAKVIRDKGRNRVLSFKIKKRDPNVSVQFVEQLADGTTQILGESEGSSGKLHFKAGPGPGGRRNIIAADILPDESIGSSKVIAHYTAPKPSPAGRPGKITVKRSGTGLKVTFRKASNAVRYIVRAKVARRDGRPLHDRQGPARHAARDPARHEGDGHGAGAGARRAARQGARGQGPLNDGFGDEAVLEPPDPVDLDGHDVAVAQQHLRLAAEADARGRARQDQVARLERRPLADRRDQVRDREDHQVGRRLLQRLAVDDRAQRQLARVRDLVGGDEPRADRRRAVPRLALHPLVRLRLVVAHRHVVGDRVAGDVLQRVGLGDAAGARADDDDQLALVVDRLRFRRHRYVVERAAQRRRELREQHRVVRRLAVRLLDVRRVVQADADDLARARDDGQVGDLVERDRRRRSRGSPGRRRSGPRAARPLCRTVARFKRSSRSAG